MKFIRGARRFIALMSMAGCATLASAGTVHEVTSAYHHIRVVDESGYRTLCFDDATETRMLLQDPLKGHFEYTEYFHMPMLWHGRATNVLMIGLGGGSAQRSYEHYYPQTKIQTVEIDPTVIQVARDYFRLQESERQKVEALDGRVFLRRSSEKYDIVLMDAYLGGRYGSGIPQHLATKEFFELVRDHMTTNGVLAYNVIGSLHDWHADIVGAMYKTLKTVFPQVYFFPAKTSRNVVVVATRAPGAVTIDTLRQRGMAMMQAGKITLPNFRERVEVFQPAAPPNSANSPLLTDDYAPVEGLVGGGGTGPRR